ncbi:hypothetical protein AB0M80_38060 [Amycolatopsis sp. NPDC051045]|uniref:hypothetical protein n=1 Tax=Amycolatopsis sp. NPDC051045 TaxID=3156922 RepID=UPI0034280F30
MNESPAESTSSTIGIDVEIVSNCIMMAPTVAIPTVASHKRMSGNLPGKVGISSRRPLLSFGTTTNVSTINGRTTAAKLRKPTVEPPPNARITKKKARPLRRPGSASPGA